jgi:hypothetical protein
MSKQFVAIVNVGDSSLGNNGFIKYRKISFLTKFKVFIDGKYPKWRFATIYDKETREKLEVWKR